MPSTRSVLIVEDDESWRDIYASAVTAEGFGIVRAAGNLAEAAELIDQIRFSVALIDVGLDITDDQNADGLRVLECIRSLGDETSLIVVTGRSGTDVLRITRDAIMKHYVQDILSKGELVPTVLREAIHQGVGAFTTAVTQQLERRSAQGLKILYDFTGNGADKFGGLSRPAMSDKLAHRLLADWLPILPEKQGSQPAEASPVGIPHAVCWSRSIGQPIAIAFASAADLNRTIETASSAELMLGGYPVRELLQQVSWNDMGGAVFALGDARRNSFSESEPQ